MKALTVPPLVWLRYLPVGPLILLGLCLLLVAFVPAGDVQAVYLALAFAALGIMGLAVVSVRELQRLQNRVSYPLTIGVSLLCAYVLPPIVEFYFVGVGLVVLGLLAKVVSARYEAGLTFARYLIEVIRGSDALDYAAVFDAAGGAAKLSEEAIGVSRIKWRMLRFALPGTLDEQIAAWRRVGAAFHEAMQKLDALFDAAGQGGSVWVVFDIDMGGFFFARIHADRYVFAATLDQQSMNDRTSERDVRRLVRGLMARTSARRATTPD